MLHDQQNAVCSVQNVVQFEFLTQKFGLRIKIQIAKLGSQTENNLKFEIMLSDSKIREAGFIRNSSSRKIIYQPDPSPKGPSSDDSFSSFEYDSTEKLSIQGTKKSFCRDNQQIVKRELSSKQQKIYESTTQQAAKKVVPQIPKPAKKPLQQSAFQNQRLKNNFFEQPQPAISPQPPKQLPRNSTPYFMEGSLKQDLQQVTNICNRIGSMKLEGNFSFNPKVNNRLTKDKGVLGLDTDDKRDLDEWQIKDANRSSFGKGSKVPESSLRKLQHNNYFSHTKNPGNKFQYDFQSSSGVSEDGENQSDNQRDNEPVRYYQEQQRQRTQPENMFKTKPKLSNNATRINSNAHHQHDNHLQRKQPHIENPFNHSRQVQNEQSSSDQEQLITNYNKDDFGVKIPIQMRKKKNQAENLDCRNKGIQEQEEGVITTNGGVCFNVDVKQFSQNASVLNDRHVRRVNLNKKKKTNQKEEILKRREMAKIYSKQARFRLFGFA